VIPLAMSCVLLLALPAQGTGAGQASPLLASSQPGSYSLRIYDRALVVTGQADEDYVLTVAVPEQPRWLALDGKRLARGTWKWASGALEVHLKGGRHVLLVALAGDVKMPGPVAVPVLLKSATPRQLGTIEGWQDFDGFSGRGRLSSAEPFSARPRVLLRPGAEVTGKTLTLAVGNTVVDRWSSGPGRLLARRRVVVAPNSEVTLEVRGENAAAAIQGIVLENARFPTDPPRVRQMPKDGIIVEAEDFSAEGAGHVQVSRGLHVDEHGGASLYSNVGNGHWLEWEVEVPATGDYDLFARIACDPPYSLRELRVDGRLPAAGFALIRFPHTGGWGYSAEEWWAVQVAGGSAELPPLHLTKGKHRLRLKGVGPNHLNLDYFVLRKHAAVR